MLGYVHKDTETGCLIPVTTAGPVGGTVEKLEYGCDKNYALPLTETTSGEGYVGVSCECPIYYNPVSGTLTVNNITGNITNAEIAECVCVTTTSNNTTYSIPLICDCHIYKEVNQRLNYNPATNELQAFSLRGQCVDYYCADFEEATIDTLTSTTVTASSFRGTATCAISADAISDGTVLVKAQCNNELNMTPNVGCTFWISYRGGTTNICFGNGSGTGALGDVYAANFYGNVASARQVTDTVSAGNAADLVYSQMADNDFFRIRVGGGSNDGWAEIATADDGSEPIYVRQYTGVFTNVARTATLLDGIGNTSFPGSVNSHKVNGSSWREAAAVFRHDAYLPTGDIWYPFLSQCVCNAGYQFQLGWLGVMPDAWAIYETKNANKWWFNATDGSFDTGVLCTRTICFY